MCNWFEQSAPCEEEMTQKKPQKKTKKKTTEEMTTEGDVILEKDSDGSGDGKDED